MSGFRLSTITWKWLICLFAATAALLLLQEARQAFRPLLLTHQHGTLGATLNDHLGQYPENHGNHELRILQLAADSPLLAYGARPGDQLRYDRTVDRWRRFRIDEEVGLTLTQGSVSRHLTVRAIATPIPFVEVGDYVARFVLTVPALLFSLLVGVKQGGNRSQRALARMFCAVSLVFYIGTNYSPAGPVLYACKLLQLTSYPLLWYWFLQFSLYYQAYHSSPLRSRLMRLLPAYGVLTYANAAYALAFGLGMQAPLLLQLTGITILGGLVLSVCSLAEGWRQSIGELRERHRWLLLSFAMGAVPVIPAWIPELDAGYQGLRWTIVGMLAGQLAMYIGLAYSVLRHRVFNFEFAISRMVVFSVVSILLLCVFGVVERLSSSLLHGGGHADAPPVTLAIDGLIALAVYLVFHQLHNRVERWVERIFFHDWHENEEKLRQYIRQAAHVTSIDALLESFRNAVDRFTGQAGCAIYLRHADGGYHLATDHTLEQAPERIETDAPIAVALRSDMTLLRMERAAIGLPGELAVPMSHRGALYGFVLVGRKRGSESYRPDEMAILSFAAHQIGLDLHALRVDLLENEVNKLSHQVEQQDLELLLMAGRRKTPRMPIQQRA